MRLQLDEARNGPLEWSANVPVAAVDASHGGEGVVIGGVDCRGSLKFVGPDFLLQAKLRYRQRLCCDRCLTAYERDVELPLAFVVAGRPEDPNPDANEADADAAARELAPEDMSILAAPGGAVDLAVVVHEQVELNRPMKPVCDPQCPGLCPRCGADRGRETCTCVNEQVDPRWSGLEAIRERLGGTPGRAPAMPAPKRE